MTLDTLRAVFLWYTVISYALLLVWFLAFSLGHEWMYRLHGRWFQLSIEQFDAIHYGGMAIYKIGILLLGLMPYLALLIAG